MTFQESNGLLNSLSNLKETLKETFKQFSGVNNEEKLKYEE